MRITGFKEIFFCLLAALVVHTPLYAYRVYVSSAPSRTTQQGIMDNRDFPFVAQYADGIYIQPAGWNRISATERKTMIDQFTNRNVIIEEIFNNQNLATIAAVTSLPASTRITAFMLYSDGGAPPMNAAAITKIASQRPPMPIIINCRNFATNNNNIQVVLNNDSIQGMNYEVGATKDNTKLNDIVNAIRYALDRSKIFNLLIPNQGTAAYNVSAVKYMFSYIKSSLPASYINSDNLIFSPANYNYDIDFFISPETEGANTTTEICKWLIEQKTKPLVPAITFSSPLDNSRFDNHKSLTVSLSVSHAVNISNVELFLDNVSLGKDFSAPFTWNGGVLADLSSGMHDLKAVATDVNGVKGDNIVQVRILKVPLPIPGTILAGDVYSYTATANMSVKELYINNEYRGDVLNYKLNVAKTGSYRINFGVYVSPAKNYGGDLILYNGTTELGRVSTPYNDPSNRNPLIVSNPYPELVLNYVPLTAGIQTLTLKFAHINEPQVMFSFMNIDFQLQNSPTITLTKPLVTKKSFQDYSPDAKYLANSNISVSLNATTTAGSISKVELFLNNQLIRSISSAPFIWNNSGQDALLNNLPAGEYTLKAVATDNSGLYSVKSIQIEVINKKPFSRDNQIPGTIEGENYDLGGEGIGYHDLNTINNGIQYRWPGLRETNDCVGVTEYFPGKYAIGWTLTGEWLDYTINVSASGIYDLSFYASAAASGKSFSASIDGNGLGSKLVKNNGIAVYDSVTISNVSLSGGVHSLRINITNGGLNFDRVVFVKTATTGFSNAVRKDEFGIYPNPAKESFILKTNTSKTQSVKIFSLTGKLVYSNPEITDNYSIPTAFLGKEGIYCVQINGLTKKLIIAK